MDGPPRTSTGNRPGSGFSSYFQRSKNRALPSRSGISGTASRLTTASNRPGTRSSLVQSFGVVSHINVVDRPMFQQGLVTPRTGVRAPHRQIRDKSYFMRLLQSKVNELTAEIYKLTKETDVLSKEKLVCVIYKKRAEVQASELKDLRGQLADYNLLVDKLNTNTEMSNVQKEYRNLKNWNEATAETVDNLFEQRQEREAQVTQLEAEIARERHIVENLTKTMSPKLHMQYNELKKVDSELQRTAEKLQRDLDLLVAEKMALEEELSISQV